jgi:hypothetical protein
MSRVVAAEGNGCAIAFMVLVLALELVALFVVLVVFALPMVR